MDLIDFVLNRVQYGGTGESVLFMNERNLCPQKSD